MKFNYDGKIFRAVQNTRNGDSSMNTLFHYSQKGEILSADYSGGKIVQGCILGKVDKKGNIDMRYIHINDKGELMTGICHSRPEKRPDGRIRLHEEWQWTSGDKSSGFSIVEEIISKGENQ